MSERSGTRGTTFRKGALLLGWLALFSAAVVLLVDLSRLPETYAFPRLVKATTISEAAPRIGRARAVNAVVAEVAREMSGGELTALVVPTDIKTLLAVEADVFGGRQQATLDPRLMRPFLGFNPTVADYDPVLDTAQEAALTERGLVEYPLNVFGLRSQGNRAGESRQAEESEFVLFVDSERLRTYVIPLSVAQAFQIVGPSE